MKDTYDVVVVGGGSAGCVLAARLAESSDRSVFLLEVGPDYGPTRLTGGRDDILDGRQLPMESRDWGFGDSLRGLSRPRLHSVTRLGDEQAKSRTPRSASSHCGVARPRVPRFLGLMGDFGRGFDSRRLHRLG
jgi:choline dehydrogenase-like flavoprotein